MADGFIVRKGGGAAAERTAVPTINFVSKTQTEIVVTFKNNDAAEADVFYGLTSPLTDKVKLATNTTSNNITFSGLDVETQYTISAYAIVTDPTLKKIKSEVVSTNITTDAAIYTAATGGTTEEYDDDGKRYRSHTFTSNGTFQVTTVGDADGNRNKVDYLIIAGGGGTGSRRYAGGGGAGGYRTTVGTSGGNSSAESKITVTAQGYDVVIGGGGSSSTLTSNSNSGASNGGNSSVFGIISTGGSFGSAFNTLPGNGGSGGGMGGRLSDSTSVGQGIAGQGSNGGQGETAAINETRYKAGGGGGAGQAGQRGSLSGNGGDGLANTIRTGSPEFRGGGGGGGRGDTLTESIGGLGGGGNAGVFEGAGPQNGVANTGGGAGATTEDGTAATGGSGIVIIRYEIAPSV
jgi:hypothetical protein